jgi:hypothetical protein
MFFYGERGRLQHAVCRSVGLNNKGRDDNSTNAPQVRAIEKSPLRSANQGQRCLRSIKVDSKMRRMLQLISVPAEKRLSPL